MNGRLHYEWYGEYLSDLSYFRPKIRPFGADWLKLNLTLYVSVYETENQKRTPKRKNLHLTVFVSETDLFLVQ
jgi:hypothetical protein